MLTQMKVILSTGSMSPDAQLLCQARLGELSESDFTGLERFAQWLLDARLLVGVAADVTHSAVESLQLGMATDRGRKPRPVDLTDRPAFLRYMRGVVASKVDAASRRNENVPPVVELSNDMVVDENTPAKNAELADIKVHLFEQLRERAHWKLLPTIEAWEKVFEGSDRIPAVNGHRQYVIEVRILAQEIVGELDCFSYTRNTGGQSAIRNGWCSEPSKGELDTTLCITQSPMESAPSESRNVYFIRDRRYLDNNSTLWPPAAAISSARFTFSCPLTSEKSCSSSD